MGREMGGGYRMGNTCIPVVHSFLYTQNQFNMVKLKNKIKLKIKLNLRDSWFHKPVTSVYENI